MALKLGVNIDHVATLRQARYALLPDWPGAEPSLVEAAREALAGGADSITIHLREDRRHIQDADVYRIRREVDAPLNLELGNTPEILDIAIDVRPEYVCLVPENRREITTEGGLNVVAEAGALGATAARLRAAGILVSFFVDPDPLQIEASRRHGADMVELHTGPFANADASRSAEEVSRLREAASLAHGLGLQVNAGHGITTGNLSHLLGIPHLVELNIGHHLVSRAVIVGLRAAVGEMRALMNRYSG